MEMFPCVSPPLRGVNVVPFLEFIGLPEKIVCLLRDSTSGYALTAYAMYKVIYPGILGVGIEMNIKHLYLLSASNPVKVNKQTHVLTFQLVLAHVSFPHSVRL